MTDITEAAPAAAAPTHRYHHPDGYGLGRHHAGEDLIGRPANPGMPDGIAAQLGLALRMDQLDLNNDTPVALVGHDEERGLHLVQWTDQTGTVRVTSINPDVFAEYFQEI